MNVQSMPRTSLTTLGLADAWADDACSELRTSCRKDCTNADSEEASAGGRPRMSTTAMGGTCRYTQWQPEYRCYQKGKSSMRSVQPTLLNNTSRRFFTHL